MKTTVIVLTTAYLVYLTVYAIKKSLRIARIKRAKDMQKAKKMLRMGIRYSKVIEPPFKWKSWSAWRKYIEHEYHYPDVEIISDEDKYKWELQKKMYFKENKLSNKDVFEIARRLATK